MKLNVKRVDNMYKPYVRSTRTYWKFYLQESIDEPLDCKVGLKVQSEVDEKIPLGIRNSWRSIIHETK